MKYEKDKFHMLSFIYGILKKKMRQMNLATKQKQTHDVEKKLMVTEGRG